jgi:imidazolonepropionase-like amidohydrolase
MRIGRTIRCSTFAFFVLALYSMTSAADGERYVILDRGGGDAGYIQVSSRGSAFIIDWQTLNNGRGAHSRERLELDKDGLPRSWKTETRSDFGSSEAGTGSGAQSFREDKGHAEWVTGGRAERRTLDGSNIFVMPGASQWALGVYARALLKRPDLSLDALPSGKLRLEKLREETLDGTPVTVYLLHGPDADHSETVRLDASGALFAVGEGNIVRDGRQRVAAVLRQAQLQREEEAHVALQKKLLHTFETHVRVFDPASGQLGVQSSVLFFHDHITGIEPLDRPDEPDETVIDGEGGTLIPGLHDTHYHASLAGPEGAWLSLAAGVTTARDMGSNNAFLQGYLADIASGRLPGPRILPSGLIEAESPFALRSTGFLVDNREAALQAVRWYAERGYLQIKIYNSVHPDWVPALASEAHALGLRVAGHIPAFTTPDAMIDAGYDEITHANQLMLGWVLEPGEDTRTPLRLTAMSRFAALDLNSTQVQRTLAHLKAKGTAVEPTLAIMRRLLLNRTGEVEPEDRWWFSHLPQHFAPGHFETVLPGFTIMPIKTPADDAAYREAAAKMIELVNRLREQGTLFYAGSDDNNGFVLQRELELFTTAGLTAAQALTRATLESARYLGHEQEWGSIVRGKSADFFLVPGDPTADIKAIHSVRMTVAQGRVYFPSEIYRALGIQPFIAPPRASPPRTPDRAPVH